MDDNPYQSPQSVGERGRGFPRIPTMLFHAAGLMLLGVSGTLLTASYATDVMALRALGIGIALGALAGLCFLFPVVRWLRGR